ncbi:MAG: hypothetical protein ACI8QC_002505 [Planctomycetota bacterium]
MELNLVGANGLLGKAIDNLLSAGQGIVLFGATTGDPSGAARLEGVYTS